jgi:hypothetical protein
VQFTGFDMQTPNVAGDIVRMFVEKHEPASAAAVTAAATAAINATAATGGSGFGVATGAFPIARAAGKRVRYSAYIKTEGVTRGYAGLWWRVDGTSGVLAFDNMSGRGVTGSRDWSRYTIDLPVDAAVRNINFGMLLTGDGTAWFDDVTIELDGVPYVDDAFDLGFESETPRGFFTGGEGYRVQVDTSARRSGRQSLRMQYVAPANATPAPTAAAVASTWKDIVSRRWRDGRRCRVGHPERARRVAGDATARQPGAA